MHPDEGVGRRGRSGGQGRGSRRARPRALA
jgi:hypothetical protein